MVYAIRIGRATYDIKDTAYITMDYTEWVYTCTDDLWLAALLLLLPEMYHRKQRVYGIKHVYVLLYMDYTGWFLR